MITCKTMMVLIFMAALPVLAQVTTNTPPDLPPLPGDKSAFWQLAIAGATPLIVWAATLVVPKLPRKLLPVLTPFIGIALGTILNWLAGQNFTWYESGAAGLLGVGVREIFHQQITKRITDEPEG